MPFLIAMVVVVVAVTWLIDSVKENPVPWVAGGAMAVLLLYCFVRLAKTAPPRDGDPGQVQVPEIGGTSASGHAWTRVPDDRVRTWPLRRGIRLLLRYRAASGEMTDREVRPWAMESRPDGDVPALLVGRCQMARATRSFRLDRVVSAADAETGEVVPDPAAWLLARVDPHQEPPVPWTKRKAPGT